jgi:hypothetical protein
MEFFVMTPEVSLWDFKMLSAIMSLVSFLFSAAHWVQLCLLPGGTFLSILLGEIWIGSWWRRRQQFRGDEGDEGNGRLRRRQRRQRQMNVCVVCVSGVESRQVMCHVRRFELGINSYV